MAGFPPSIETLQLPGGLWLRVKVLTLTEALGSQQGLQAAVSVAMQAASTDGEQVVTEGPLTGQRLAVVLKTAEVMAGVARLAVIGHAWGDDAPAAWLPCTIVPNPQDEDAARHRYCVATIDQVAPGWVFQVGDIALRAALEAQRKVRPLPPAAT